MDFKTTKMDIKEKRIIVHRLLWKLGAVENKADLLEAYGAKSTTELTDKQIDDLIYRLKLGLLSRTEAPKELRTWRSNALTLLNKCGVYATNSDWSSVNRFMLDKRICGKLLYELTVDELKVLSRKLRSIAEKKETNDKHTMLNSINLN